MPDINQSISKIIEDLKLEAATPEEKEKAISMLQERFNNVVISNLILLADGQQKQKLLNALAADKDVEEAIDDSAASIPNFAEIIEQALLDEYQSIKNTIQEKG